MCSRASSKARWPTLQLPLCLRNHLQRRLVGQQDVLPPGCELVLRVARLAPGSQGALFWLSCRCMLRFESHVCLLCTLQFGAELPEAPALAQFAKRQLPSLRCFLLLLCLHRRLVNFCPAAYEWGFTGHPYGLLLCGHLCSLCHECFWYRMADVVFRTGHPGARNWYCCQFSSDITHLLCPIAASCSGTPCTAQGSQR